MSRVLSLAGFQVTLIGRFWVTPEVEEVARKLLGPKPFKATTKGKKFEKVCREAFDRERE
jgi:hypothetical protein